MNRDYIVAFKPHANPMWHTFVKQYFSHIQSIEVHIDLMLTQRIRPRNRCA